MNTSVNHGTAKIYQFPQRSRAAAAEPAKRYEAATIGSSWYHEEAIRETVRGYGTRDTAPVSTAPVSAVIVPLNFPRQ